jgi:nucleotide-binding universal stress UspA family protein
MDNFQRIFAAIDFSSGSDEGLRQAHDRAVATGAKLAVCHVVPELWSHTFFHHTSRIEELKVASELERASEAASTHIKDVTGRTESQFDLIVDEGAPYASILTHAEKWLADLIVVGSQGKTMVPEARLGGVANKIIRYAHCPVLIARHCEGSHNIVAGTDFSDPALPAIRTAAAEAQRTGGELTIVYCLGLVWPAAGITSMALGGNPFNISDKQVNILEGTAMEKLADALNRLHIHGRSSVTTGAAEFALIETAAHLKADLLVVGTARGTALRRLLPGSVAETVAIQAPCSVLMVRLHGDA